MSIQWPFEASTEFNSECLSPIEVLDLLTYLVLETSSSANKQFNAFKSLKAYTQMVSGFVTSVQGAEIVDKIVVAAKVITITVFSESKSVLTKYFLDRVLRGHHSFFFCFLFF